MPGSPAPARSSSVQSVARATALLRCFEDSVPELTLTDLSRATGLTMSTTYRLATTLVEGGLLHRGPDSDHYAVGPLLVSLARTAIVPAGSDRVAGLLRGLTERTGESASLGIRDGRDVVVLVCVESHHALRFDRPAGTRVPIHVSAMGRALLAFADEPPAAAVKALAPLERFTPRTLTSQRALVADLEATHERGYGFVDEEQVSGVRSLAAPVLGGDGFAVSALGVQGPASRLSSDRLDGIAAALRDTARSIEILTERGYLL
jgi:IclR family acetate operon transcriptional repressor